MQQPTLLFPTGLHDTVTEMYLPTNYCYLYG